MSQLYGTPTSKISSRSVSLALRRTNILIDHSWSIAPCWAILLLLPLSLPVAFWLRGNSQGAAKVGCSCELVGPRRCQCCGSCWGASRIEPCRRLSRAALESAHTAAAPTEDGRTDGQGGKGNTVTLDSACKGNDTKFKLDFWTEATIILRIRLQLLRPNA